MAYGARQARLRAAVLVFLSVCSGAAGAAPWLQAGYDAARTGATPDPGPAIGDVAFGVDVPGVVFNAAHPVIVGGAAYILTHGAADEEGGLWRIDLSDASASLVTPVQRGIAFASDGERLFVATGDGKFRAFDLEGSALWETPISDLGFPLGALFMGCTDPAVRGGTVAFLCSSVERTPDDGRSLAPPVPRRSATTVVSLDAATGEVHWSWVKNAEDESEGSVPAGASATPLSGANGLALVGEFAIAMTRDFAGRGGGNEDYLWALDDRGNVAWSRVPQRDAALVDPAGVLASDPAQAVQDPRTMGAIPAASGGVLFLKFEDLVALDPATNTEVWRQPMPRQRGEVITGQHGLAVSGNAIYVNAFATLYALDPTSREERWHFTLPSGEAWERSSLVLANRTIYARSAHVASFNNPLFQVPPIRTLYALDATTGTVRWTRDFTPEIRNGTWFLFGVGEGVLATVQRDGNVTVLGRTPASIQPAFLASSLYPAPGATVIVDLSGTRPGVQSPRLEYRADWGDGALTEWQDSPLFEHAYELPGDHTARFHVRNPAGQEASEVVTFHVGGTAPPELTAIQKAFSQDNQNATFFALGIVGTAVGGFVGLLRLQRKRGTFERELRSIEDAYVSTRERPFECERALAERKAHVRGLLLDGKLEESQCHALERRVEELTKTIRMHEIEGLLDLLPRGLARALEEVLADGRITTWERRSFLEVLAHDQVLDERMKERVRGVIDAWYARDVGAGTRVPVGGPEDGAAERMRP